MLGSLICHTFTAAAFEMERGHCTQITVQATDFIMQIIDLLLSRRSLTPIPINLSHQGCDILVTGTLLRKHVECFRMYVVLIR